ncbi:MAG: hypothetical protein Q4C07_02685 [Eubacteriales bacterium]|nr:hypothetical protein [Eubacteriales bacterium]
MEKKPIQAKNVVSFGDGKTINRPKPAAPAVEPVAEPVEASETVVKKAESGFIKAEAVETAADAVETEVANEVSEEVPLREVPEPEAIETKPLNLRQDRYLDETPQEPDWADEEDEFDDYEDDDETLSTFAEVFIPLHDDTTGAIVRKGLVIVSLIVILCCIVAIVMKQTGFSGVIMPDISALTDRAVHTASIALSNL